LLQVCNAIHFAHSCGVVHRDLKPANIMVGDFGEVYVLDWGIALRVVDANGKRVWHPVDPARVEGTLAYMAPEQAAAIDEPISERTDVFQLGALLYALLSGRPPFAHDNPAELVRAMCATEVPPLPDHVPRELVAICMRALTREVAARYESALAFKAAVETWLQRRPSFELTRAGQRHLDSLQAAVAAGADADEVAAQFGQARFGFQRVLVVWPGNADAHAGLQAALATMAKVALQRQDVQYAEQLVKELGDDGGELRAALAALSTQLAERERQQRLEFDRLARIAQDHDKQRGAGARSALIRLLGGMFVAAFWLAQAASCAGWVEGRVWHNLAAGAVAVAVVAGIGWRFWASVARTAQNRAAYTIVLGMTVVGEAFRVCAAMMGASLAEIQILDLAVFAMTSVGVAAVFDLRLLWMSSGSPSPWVTEGPPGIATAATRSPQ
jgi:serine/threonine-protein kinase